MRLYTTPRSANGLKPLALARWRGIPLEVVEVDVYAGAGATEAYRRLHPDGRVPCLVDGSFVLWESNAIVAYLEDHAAAGPADLARRADILRWQFFEASQWQPALTQALAGSVAGRLGLGPPAPPDWRLPALQRAAGVLNGQLRCGPWLVGHAPSIADLTVAAMGAYFVGVDLPEDLRPIGAWVEEVFRTVGVGPLLESTPWAR